jgi:hypothetical protein
MEAFLASIGLSVQSPQLSIGCVTNDGDQAMPRPLKKGEVVGLWVWILVIWILLAYTFHDFWWFRPLARQMLR